jgi:molecular chaperone GrpE
MNEREQTLQEQRADAEAQSAKSPSGAPAPEEGSAAGAEETDGAVRQEGSEAATVAGDLDELLAVARQRDEYLALAQRTQADFENYRKRMAAEVQAAAGRGKAELAMGMIGVIDNLERALAAVGIEPNGDTAPAEPLAEGFFLTYRELLTVLERAGIEPFDPAGERFDPSLHEAVQKLPVDGAEAGIVVEVMQKGYRFGDQLIRPARVAVSE